MLMNSIACQSHELSIVHSHCRCTMEKNHIIYEGLYVNSSESLELKSKLKSHRSHKGSSEHSYPVGICHKIFLNLQILLESYLEHSR